MRLMSGPLLTLRWATKEYKMKLNAAYRLLASSWTGKFEIDLPASVEEIVSNTLNRLSKDYPSIAHIDVRAGDPLIMENWQLATKSHNSLILNPHVWLDHGKLKEHAKEWRSLRVDSSISGIVIHEVGHILESQVLNKLGAKKYNRILESHLRDMSSISNDEAPSVYGQEGIFEFLAEAFTAHYLGRVAPDTHPDLGGPALKMCNALWAEFNKVLK